MSRRGSAEGGSGGGESEVVILKRRRLVAALPLYTGLLRFNLILDATQPGGTPDALFMAALLDLVSFFYWQWSHEISINLCFDRVFSNACQKDNTYLEIPTFQNCTLHTANMPMWCAHRPNKGAVTRACKPIPGTVGFLKISFRDYTNKPKCFLYNISEYITFLTKLQPHTVVIARAAILLECANLVHNCNKGQWPYWLKANIAKTSGNGLFGFKPFLLCHIRTDN